MIDTTIAHALRKINRKIAASFLLAMTSVGWPEAGLKCVSIKPAVIAREVPDRGNLPNMKDVSRGLNKSP